MRRFFVLCLLVTWINSYSQTAPTADQLIAQLTPGAPLPENILSTRTAVFYSPNFSMVELQKIQAGFQKTGIDAVAYYDLDKVFAGKDVSIVLAEYLNKRAIENLVILLKGQKKFSVAITAFNTKETFVEKNQYSWTMENAVLSDLLQSIYLTASAAYKNENLLIIDGVENDLPLEVIKGRRQEFFATDLTVDKLAVPRFGNEVQDKILMEIFKDYPYKYELTDPGTPEEELRKKGFFYVLSYIHTRGIIARELLGYDISKGESAIVSVTYPNGEAKLKNYPAEQKVYKFYFKHIDSGSIFLGTKWDADLTWDQALRNQIRGFKAELRIN
jgi:hypothetical protein